MKTLRAHFLWPIVMLGSLVAFTGAVFAADSVPVDPTVDPQGALGQFWQSVVAKKWGLAAVIGTMLLVALVRFIAPRMHDKIGAFVLSTRVSAALAFVAGMLSAVATQLMKGGTLSVNVLVYGFTFGVGAIGGYNAFWDLLFPADKNTGGNGTADSAAELAKKTPPTPPTPPPPVRAGMLLPLVFIAFTFTGCGTVCASASSSPTCARKFLTGVDALDGAAARISRRWLQKCGESARALAAAGKATEADAAYTRCEAIGGKMVATTRGVEDGANTASDAVDVGEAANQKDYGGILQPVASFIEDLRKVFADAGVLLPNIPLPAVN